MRWEAVKKTVLWTVFRPTVRARKREDVDFRAAEIVSPAGPTMTVNAPIWGVFHACGLRNGVHDLRLAADGASIPSLLGAHSGERVVDHHAAIRCKAGCNEVVAAVGEVARANVHDDELSVRKSARQRCGIVVDYHAREPQSSCSVREQRAIGAVKLGGISVFHGVHAHVIRALARVARACLVHHRHCCGRTSRQCECGRAVLGVTPTLVPLIQERHAVRRFVDMVFVVVGLIGAILRRPIAHERDRLGLFRRKP